MQVLMVLRGRVQAVVPAWKTLPPRLANSTIWMTLVAGCCCGRRYRARQFLRSAQVANQRTQIAAWKTPEPLFKNDPPSRFLCQDHFLCQDGILRHAINCSWGRGSRSSRFAPFIHNMFIGSRPALFYLQKHLPVSILLLRWQTEQMLRLILHQRADADSSG